MPFIVTHWGPASFAAHVEGYEQEAIERRAFASLEGAREHVMRAYQPFDHPDGRDINQRVLFLDGTPNHVESLRTTGWCKIDESGGSALLPDGTVLEVQPCNPVHLAERTVVELPT